ncbi:MAG: two-component regulator propeller domain-containing protein, partial [Bacteroidota bacterium]
MRRIIHYRQMITLLLICFAISLLGQSVNKSSIRFSNISKSDGLSSNYVTQMVKDHLGFLWIATSDGLCRYDGPGNIQVFEVDTVFNKDGLASNHIQSLF